MQVEKIHFESQPIKEQEFSQRLKDAVRTLCESSHAYHSGRCQSRCGDRPQDLPHSLTGRRFKNPLGHPNQTFPLVSMKDWSMTRA